MTGECMRKDMKSLAIERHNAAGRIVAQAIRHGALSNCVMIGDVRNAEKCNAFNLHSTRVPEWLLSNDDLSRTKTNCTVARLDLMLVTITKEEAQALGDWSQRGMHEYRTGMLSSRPDAHAIKVLIVEVGYLSKLRYKEKVQAKLDRHKQLLQSLECWTPVQGGVTNVMTGASGTLACYAARQALLRKLADEVFQMDAYVMTEQVVMLVCGTGHGLGLGARMTELCSRS